MDMMFVDGKLTLPPLGFSGVEDTGGGVNVTHALYLKFEMRSDANFWYGRSLG